MTELTAGVLGLSALFVLLALRVPVGLTLLAVGAGGIAALNGLNASTATMASTAYTLSSNYTLVIIPLFVLMGNVASLTGMSRQLFDAVQGWIGHWRGGLASASILGCAGFAAVSGSSIATSITMGRVALPEMKRAGYDDAMATGSVAAGGTLGILIPPSAGFVVYSILTEQSIGQLFIAGILPGILLAALFVVTVQVMSALNPSWAPKTDKAPWNDRIRLASGALPLLIVICLSIGGIYLGVFTPVEASGVGALLTILIAAIQGKLRLPVLGEALLETVRTTAMLFFIIIGASVFGPFLALTHLPDAIYAILQSFSLGPYGTLALILIIYIILGTFLETFAMLVITLPVFIPIVSNLGFDLVWFGVIVVMVVEMGLITPPVGLNVFVVKAIAQDVPMKTIFAGVLPFWCAMAVAIVIVSAFPSIALFLPETMVK